MLVEWLTEDVGCGFGALAVLIAQHFLDRGGPLVVIDAARDFFALTAARYGVNLEQVILVIGQKCCGRWSNRCAAGESR